MAITLGTLSLDERYVAVKERFEEVGGRDERRVELTGLVSDVSTVAGIEARLEEILREASTNRSWTTFSVRAGRRLWVRRLSYEREVQRGRKTGVFKLVLEVRDFFEESDTETVVTWEAFSGSTREFASSGTGATPISAVIVPEVDVTSWALSDGTNTLSAQGVFAAGVAIRVDGVARKVWVGEREITGYVEGTFPEVRPEGTTLTYTDSDEGAHAAAITVSYRDRWW